MTPSDTLCVEKVRSGLNRLPLEYVHAQHLVQQQQILANSQLGAAGNTGTGTGTGNGGDKTLDKLPGFLLMSEFASATRVLQARNDARAAFFGWEDALGGRTRRPRRVRFGRRSCHVTAPPRRVSCARATSRARVRSA